MKKIWPSQASSLLGKIMSGIEKHCRNIVECSFGKPNQFPDVISADWKVSSHSLALYRQTVPITAIMFKISWFCQKKLED